ncbi:MAG: GNAT family N-acetyltransferase [Candidatus Syntrophosphaera sp.]
MHCPGCNEHWLVHVLRDSPDFIPELDLVAELDGEIVGNIMWARSLIRAPQGREHPVLTFGPVSVLPAHQNEGIGKALITTTLGMARKEGHGAVLIYGDPDYYKRFGFVAAEVFGIRTKGGLFSPALQALELKPGYLKGIGGCFEEAAVYDVDPAAAEEFDSAFPPRDKLVTESQKRFLDLLSQAHE